MRTAVFPGRRRSSRAKGCVLATLFQAVRANEVTLAPGRLTARNRSRLSLLEPVGEGGVAAADALAALQVRSQAEWPVVALEATWTRPRGLVALQSATRSTLATLQPTGEDPNPAVGSPTPAPFWLDPSFRP